MWVDTFFFRRDRVTIVRNPIVPIKDRSEPREETVFQKVKASG